MFHTADEKSEPLKTATPLNKRCFKVCHAKADTMSDTHLHLFKEFTDDK